MSKSRFRRLSEAMLPPIVILLSAAPTAWADIQDYEFRLVQRSARPGEETVLAVKLVHKTTGNAIPDAIIFGRRLDMAPAGMPTMTADLEPLPSNEPGVYQFKTILAMEGNWQFSLAAKIQGETGTLLNRLVLEATN